jgi:hypothetical protein
MQRLGVALAPIAVWVAALCLVMFSVMALGVIYAIGCVVMLVVVIFRSDSLSIVTIMAIVCLTIWFTR